MKIGIQTWGSHGDIKPFLLLGKELSKEHQVTLVYTSIDQTPYEHHSHQNFLIRSASLKIEGDSEAFFKKILKARTPFDQLLLLFKHLYNPALPEMYQQSKNLVAENDVLIGHMMCLPLKVLAKEKSKIFFCTQLCPVGIPHPTHSPLGLPDLGTRINPYLWKLADFVSVHLLFAKTQRFLSKKGHQKINSIWELYQSKPLTLIASSTALSKPKFEIPEHMVFTGFWEVSTDLRKENLSELIREFLNTGEAPIFCTFGSLNQMNEKGNLKLFEDISKSSKSRAIIQTPLKSGIEGNILYIDSIDHLKIFSFCQLIVHHGGAGTTQSSIHSGVPSLIISHGLDQDYWGKLLTSLKMSPCFFRRINIDVQKATLEIKRIKTDRRYLEVTKSFSNKIHAEKGIEKTVALINQWAKEP